MQNKRKRTSIIWKIPREEFEKTIKNARSISEVLKHFGFAISGGTHKMIKR